jgi:hypothetical protein
LSAVLAKTIELDRRNIFSQGPKFGRFVQKMQQVGVALAAAGHLLAGAPSGHSNKAG